MWKTNKRSPASAYLIEAGKHYYAAHWLEDDPPRQQMMDKSALHALRQAVAHLGYTLVENPDHAENELADRICRILEKEHDDAQPF